MKKSSERLVVFVTPAQKRAIAASAQGMGISVSELLRRALLAFDATADQVRAARIVDSMRVPQPDALNDTLRRLAQALPDMRRAGAPVAAAGLPAKSAVPDEATAQPLPVAATVARALAEQAAAAQAAGTARKTDDEGCDMGLDEQTVARVIARKGAADARAGGDVRQAAPSSGEATARQAPPRARAARALVERDDETAVPEEPANG